MTYAITNPRWVRPYMIDVEWDHPVFGPMTYSAVDQSEEVEMQAIWDGIQRGDFGPIAPLPERA